MEQKTQCEQTKGDSHKTEKKKQTVREPCFTEKAEHKLLMFNFPVITMSNWSEAKAEKILLKSKSANKNMESGGVLN